MIRNNNEIFEKISKEFIPQLRNTTNENRPLIIAFSGIPGAGKTSLSEKLEKRYNGVIISSRNIRDIINELNLTNNPDQTEELLQDYTFNLLANIPFENKRIILDKSLDREYKRFFEVCKLNNLKYFIIRMDILGKEAIERIVNREEIDVDKLRKSMEKWVADYNDFGKNAKYDLIIDGKNPNMKKLFKKLDKLLN
ncbi:AAA family ATPase [Candidatus Pacearchaeota archaeon]|nr:AAA family ATPase [Candidatus Pacearchaeota archaeon]